MLCGLPEPNDLVVWRTSAFWTLTDTATEDGLVHTQMTTDGLAFSSFVLPHLEVTPEGRVPGASADSAPIAPGARITRITRAARAMGAARTAAEVHSGAAPAVVLAKTVTVPPHRMRA